MSNEEIDYRATALRLASMTGDRTLAQVAATVHVGDQLARIADVLEQTTSPRGYRGEQRVREVNIADATGGRPS